MDDGRRGVLHKEYDKAGWAKKGGIQHMVQLWVNLPAADKMEAPGYQQLTAADIGSHDLGDGAGTVRVVAGTYGDHRGPARTHSPMNVWNLTVRAGRSTSFSFPSHEGAAVLVIDGAGTVNGRPVGEGDLVVFDDHGERIEVSYGTDDGTDDDTGGSLRLLVLNGQRLGEPVVAYGPFVMNTTAQIAEAFDDFERGAFGHLAG